MGLSVIDTKLSEREIDEFHETGYHIQNQLFWESEITELRRACSDVCNGVYETGVEPDERYWNPGDDPLAMHKIDNCWKSNSVIKNAVTNSRLGHIAAQLLGVRQMRLWHDQLSWKPANGGKVATWHQDWAYWQMIRECRTMSCWIALDDVDPMSGPMIYLVGSHKMGLVPKPTAISGDNEMFPDIPELRELPRVPVIIPAGAVAFHHGLTFHGSGKNQSNHERGALVSHMLSGDCTYRPMNTHICEKKMREYDEYPEDGEVIRGPQFPITWHS